MSNFGLNPENYLLVLRILQAWLPDHKVYVFGSRARGDFKRYSDLDLAIDAKVPVPIEKIAQLQGAFDESLLPIKVDLIDLSKASPDFLAQIRGEWRLFNEVQNSA